MKPFRQLSTASPITITSFIFNFSPFVTSEAAERRLGKGSKPIPPRGTYPAKHHCRF
ncbi:hypothetical protein Patl1_02387 [Pistacia atlantica]|uniref:Uncharacterized protein n=1 Tax=Pistacia atlantica TaxID=434234 RepID=A0ACC1C3S0_9ROSI|nr:hypothetical protein Patl1_02387 [Pistacia atlantica]